MKRRVQLLAFLLAGLLLLSLTACGGDGADNDSQDSASPSDSSSPENSPETSPEGSPASGDETYLVGICQLTQHPALDNATEGFKAALTEKLGDKVRFEEGNASNEPANCATIINGFLSSDVDLILANATASLQAAAAATDTIPILGTSITDYATALEIDDWNGTVGSNISGTSDLAPLDQQSEIIQELFPEAKKVGLLYCSGEPNSLYQCGIVEENLTGMGYETQNYAFTDSNDVASVTQAACDECDVLYVPTDNTAASNAEAIANVVLAAGTPVVAGEEGICGGCGVATLSISYYDIGYIAGEMAYEILVEGKEISTMPVQYAPTVVPKYNAANCEALNIVVPADYEPIATE